jgi:hypothetical protein
MKEAAEMSVGAQTKASGSPAAGESDSGQGTVPQNVAGLVFGRLTVLPVLVAIGWLLVGLPLLLVGEFKPVPMTVVGVPVIAIAVYLGCGFPPPKFLAGRWAFLDRPARPALRSAPLWSLVAVIAVAVWFGWDQMVFHSQFIIVTRDPASYTQFAAWISGHGSLPIPQDRAAFGGASKLLTFATPAFYQVGTSIVPQFMAGLPMVLSIGFWLSGVNSALAIAPILGALAVLTFGGLVARLVGPRWAPVAALALALSLPMMYTSRDTYSEPLAAILFIGGLSLAVDSLEADGVGARVIAGLGGLALGLTFFVRLDGASDILPVIPYCAILVLSRRRQAMPMIVGFVVGGLYGAIDGLFLTLPYLKENKSSVIPLAAITFLVVGGTVVVGKILYDRGGLPELKWKWLPTAAAVLPILITIAFILRPHFEIARQASNPGFEADIAGLQLAEGDPIDPSRVYYEISMHWVFWYIGVPVVILGTIGAAILARRCVQGRLPSWTLPLMVFSWAIVSTLYRPAITPDQPWASRRLVPAVLPGFILLAVWAVSWGIGWLREHGIGPVLRGAGATACAAALLIPPAWTSFGLHLTSKGPEGFRLTSSGLATQRTYIGEEGAVRGLCQALPKNAAVVFPGAGTSRVSFQFAEVVRGMCGHPTALLATSDVATVGQVVRSIYRAGHQPVLLMVNAGDLRKYGGPRRQVVDLTSFGDTKTLTSPPYATAGFTMTLWMSEPPR